MMSLSAPKSGVGAGHRSINNNNSVRGGVGGRRGATVVLVRAAANDDNEGETDDAAAAAAAAKRKRNKPPQNSEKFSNVTKMRSEAQAPFRVARMFFFGAFAANASLG